MEFVKMQRYESYKDSVVEWVDEVPKGWRSTKIKFHATINNGLDYKTVISDEGYPVIGSGGQFAYASRYLYDGEAVLLGRKGTIDKPLYIKGKFWTVDTMFYTVCRSTVNAKFLFYYSLSIPFSYYSTSTALPSMTQNDLKNHFLVLPSASEQTAIANFLDQKTAQIEEAIAIKERQIELLKERKQIIIQKAVTQGLNPNVLMKDSRLEWIGKVPEHWGVKKLRYLGKTQNGISAGAEYFGSGYPFVSYGDVYNNVVLPSTVNGLANSSEQDQIQYSIKEGDVLFTRTSETVDEIGFASTCFKSIDKATFAGFLIRFRPSSTLLIKEFSSYYFSSQLMRKYFVKEMNLVIRASLSQELLKNLPVLLPPIGEQLEIFNYLEEQSRKFESLIDIQKSQIEKLKEYKTTLINSAVTGKIRVVAND